MPDFVEGVGQGTDIQATHTNQQESTAMSIAVIEPVEDEAAEATVECSECSEQVEETLTVASGSEVCHDCIDANYITCEDCSDTVEQIEATMVEHGYRWVCDDCLDNNYVSCNRCDEWVGSDSTYSAYNGNEDICSSCFDYFHFCERCDYYVHSDDEDHYHDGDDSTDCCESPLESQTFTMPNGAAQDEQFTVKMPDGIISESGMSEIRSLIFDALRFDYDLRYQATNAVYYAGTDYVNKDGKFTKRVAKYLHQNYKTKISDDLLSKIGQVAQKASVGGEMQVAFTRQLNLSAGEFYHEGSCWWSEYSYSRCTLKSNGGLGMRTFDEFGHVSGRAWVFPLRKLEGGSLVPTFDTATADAFVVFNGYGDLAENAQARVLAASVEGWVSKRVSFDPGNMYVNAGGFLVGPADVVESTQYLDFHTDLHSNLFNAEQHQTKEAA